MIPAINEVMLAVSSSLAAWIVAKVTVITALALFAAWLARGSRAAVRHALLAAAFGVTLLLPIASVLVPPVHLGVPVVVENRASALPPLVSGVDQTPPVLMTDDPGDRVISAPQSSRISLSNLLLAGWIAGVAIFLLPVGIGLWQIRLLRRSGLPWRRGQSLAETIALDAGVHRRVEVLLHEGVPGPMTCGIVHPTIVLPQDAESWNEEELSRAFVHELEHVRRGDWLTHCIARIVSAVYWFHPLVWIAWRRLTLEAERSCDDAVLGRSEATAYADQLVGLAKRQLLAERSPLLAMANRADLATRVHAVLDGRQRRGRAGAFSLGLATTSAMVLVLSMSSLILVATPQAPPARTVTPPQPQSDTVQGEQSHEKPDPPRLVAQALTPAQPAPAAQAKLEFEVASVRRVEIPPAANGGVPVFFPTGGIGTSDPSRIAYRGFWLHSLIADAFGVRADQITAPAWLTKERYDIIANIPEGTTKEQFNAMLGNLLRDRFHLRFHMDSKVLPVYALRVAKNGPKFKETARHADDATVPSGPIGDRDAQGFIILPPGYKGTLAWPAPGEIFVTAQDVPMTDLARSIETAAGRPVVDETGLTGHYDFKLHREYGRGTANSGDASNPAPSVFTALQEQLGLKLESSTALFPQLIIDSIDRDPAEN
jgi:uncharacterized protein (TIGR03435 family)